MKKNKKELLNLENFTIKDFRDFLTKQIRKTNCGDCKMEFWLELGKEEEKELKLTEIGQFGLIRDMIINFKEEK